jgi:hypothetical protein
VKKPDPVLDEAVLPERLNISSPMQEEIVEVHADQLRAMTDEELVTFMNEVLGLAIKPGWPRSRIITYLTQIAVNCVDVVSA